MIAWARRAARALGRAVRGLDHHRGGAVATAAIAAAAVVLVGMAWLAAYNATALTRSWTSGVHMVVYLDHGTSATRAERIAGALRSLSAVEAVEYVSPDRAADRMRAALGERDEVAAGIDGTMMPASLEVTLGEGIRDVAAAHPVVARLEATAGVEEVELVGEWVDRAAAAAAWVERGAWIAVAAIATGAVIVLAFALRLRFGRRRREERVAELLGATWGYVRAPLVVEGLMLGAAGSAVAALALWIGYRAAAAEVSRSLSAAFGAAELDFLPVGHVVLLVAAGAACGALGAWLATGRRASA